MNEKRITVKGTGHISQKPDQIVVSIVLETKYEKYEETMRRAASELKTLRKALTSAGHERDALKTGDFNVSTDYERVQNARGVWSQKFIGYVCTHSMELELEFDMDKLGDTLSAISGCGVQPHIDIGFSIRDKEAVKEQLLRAAVSNAAEKARIIADAAGARLCDIISIDYNWSDVYMRSATRFAAGYSESECVMAPMSIDITPRDISVSDSVTIVWAIE